MTGRATSSLHRTQVALARRYLREHLADEVRLNDVARAAGAAPSHFVRVFRAWTGETPFRALTRLRLEASTRLLARGDASISRIALDTGWDTPSAFNKAFRAAFDCSPSQWRALPASRRPALLSPPPRAHDFRLTRTPRLIETAPFSVAFVREQGEYSDVSAPLAWRRLHQVLERSTEAFGPHVGASHDDPTTASPEHLRYDAGVLLAPGQRAPRGAHHATWGSGTHAVFEFRGPYRSIAAGFDTVLRAWRGPTLRNAPYLELYRTTPGELPESDQLTELWLPVEAS